MALFLKGRAFRWSKLSAYFLNMRGRGDFHAFSVPLFSVAFTLRAGLRYQAL